MVLQLQMLFHQVRQEAAKMCIQIVLLINIIFHFLVIDSSPAPTHLLLTRVGPCYEPQNTIIEVSELSVTRQSYDSLLSGSVTISEDINVGWKIMVTMQKCVDMRNIDSCDFFKSFVVVTDGCSAVENQKKIYSTLFSYASPKMVCPVQAGRYKIQNYPFFSNNSYVTVYQSKISTSVFGYRFRLDGITVNDRKIFCIEANLQLAYKRNRKWIENIMDIP